MKIFFQACILKEKKFPANEELQSSSFKKERNTKTESDYVVRADLTLMLSPALASRVVGMHNSTQDNLRGFG